MEVNEDSGWESLKPVLANVTSMNNIMRQILTTISNIEDSMVSKLSVQLADTVRDNQEFISSVESYITAIPNSRVIDSSDFGIFMSYATRLEDRLTISRLLVSDVKDLVLKNKKVNIGEYNHE